MNSTSCDCLRDILKTILILQKNARPSDKLLDTCDKKVLGKCCIKDIYNTRPITLYTCCPDGTKPLRMPVSKDPNETILSNVFRIEKLDDKCATFRVLKVKPCTNETEYIATDSFFTIHLSCVCIIKCLDDTFVDCV